MTHAKLGLLLTLTGLAFGGCVVDGDDESVADTELGVMSDQEVADACATKPPKQAVCHIPPGNPANAHTICISKSAVDKHVSLHGDHLGACDPGTGGSGQGGSAQGGSGQGGDPGSAGGPSTDDCTQYYPSCVSTDECETGSYCENGCCVPYTL